MIKETKQHQKFFSNVRPAIRNILTTVITTSFRPHFLPPLQSALSPGPSILDQCISVNIRFCSSCLSMVLERALQV